MNVQSHLPLREPTFFILLVLASGPKHGYNIIKETARLRSLLAAAQQTEAGITP